jgi:hypothetical protein
MEFHVSRAVRKRLDVEDVLFSYSGNAVFANLTASREFARRANQATAASREAAASAAAASAPDPAAEPIPILHAGALFAMGLIDELSHALVARYRETLDPSVLADALGFFRTQIATQTGDSAAVDQLLLTFTDQFPNTTVYRGLQTPAEWLASTTSAREAGTAQPMPNREAALEELLLLWLANINPAFAPFKSLFDDRPLAAATVYPSVTADFGGYFATRPPVAPEIGSLLQALMAPMLASPDSLSGQLAFMRDTWSEHLGPDFKETLRRTLLAIDTLQEEEIAIWSIFHPAGHSRHGHDGGKWSAEGFLGDEFVGFGHGAEIGAAGGRTPEQPPALNEYEAFSQDQAWMPTVVLIAKSTYVWLEQLSKKYLRHIHRLDQIPDEELALLAARGINGLWLIGLWERSTASQTIKRLRGQADAVASAYSLKDYRIAEDLGGTYAYERLRDRAAAHHIRLASDMVPNHMGIDSTWVMEHPEWFLARSHSPFPVYSFEGPDLSTEARFEIKIEDHYYSETDAAVVFRLRERSNGDTRFVYHGNDGTTFAWNDTAQLDYSKAFVREHVIQTILNVAKLFPIIRFDAAMTLAKKHVQRLWFPLHGIGGSIPSRAEYAMSQAEFDALMPHEFWREVVDRVAVEVPGTLLLAEAFWLLEGYFVRTLGMHRVYNSAFMNMLRDEENAKYRSYLKKTIEFDPDILKRYVNFMSNPDERTAIDQFGTGDKYFGTCTLLATLPGLPMFGHGQIEAFTEKYGMEYKQARYEEWPNEDLVARHQREIAPLLKHRALFAESSNFVLYDFWRPEGTVDENVYAYSNRLDHAGPWGTPARALILYNNAYSTTRGTIHLSAESMDKATGWLQSRTLKEALALPVDHDVFLAWRDTASDLEYLRRASDFDRSGFTLDLRGYQYAVFQNWRELRATAESPWDQLAAALNGAGVYNLDQSLAMLRLRPLHESLRQALTPEILQVFAAAAAAPLPLEPSLDPVPTPAAPTQLVAEPQSPADSAAILTAADLTPSAAEFIAPPEPVAPAEPATARSEVASTPGLPISPLPAAVSASETAYPAPAAHAESLFPVPAADFPLPSEFTAASEPAPEPAPPLFPSDPRLASFLDRAQLFLTQAQAALSPSQSPEHKLGEVPQTPAQSPTTQTAANLTDQAVAATHIPSLEALFTHPWPPTARLVLPTLTHENGRHASTHWTPILAWLLLESAAAQSSVQPSVPPAESASRLFDDLHLRHALAEIFTGLGAEGEDAWRLAARTRILLAHPDPVDLDTDSFWSGLDSDPDLRWLAAVNESEGVTYLNKEAFEELLWWLQLPHLLGAARLPPAGSQAALAAIEARLAHLTTTAATAGYNLAKFRAILNPQSPDPDLDATPAAELNPLSPTADTAAAHPPATAPLPAPLS